MTAARDTPAALLDQLTALGIELQAHGDRLRFRPQSAMTAELVARVKVHKAGLLALLANTKTPTGDAATPGFGSGVGDVLTATSYTTSEAELLADAPAELREKVDQVKRLWPGAEVVRVYRDVPEPEPPDAARWLTPDESAVLPAGVAALVPPRDGWKPTAWRDRLLQLADLCATNAPDRATELRQAAVVMTPALLEVFEERVEIMEHDAGLPADQAAAAALLDTLVVLRDLKKNLLSSK